MAKELGPWKIDLDAEYGYSDKNPFNWVAHPDNETGGDYVDYLSSKREDMLVIGGITDDEADYSYDDWALVLLEGSYYLFATTGCSCPSPKETWRVEIGPATLEEVRKHINTGEYSGYTLPKKQYQDFRDVLDFAAKLKKE